MVHLCSPRIQRATRVKTGPTPQALIMVATVEVAVERAVGSAAETHLEAPEVMAESRPEAAELAGLGEGQMERRGAAWLVRAQKG